MEDNRIYHIRISPEVIKNDIFKVIYTAETPTQFIVDDECCEIPVTGSTPLVTGSTFVYSSMTQILSGGTNGTSLLTGLTIPILLTENYVDIGYYSVFDGMVVQKDVMTNFIFSASTGFSNTTYYFYNTSDSEFKKYLSFSNYMIDWGDGSPQQVVTTTSPNFYSHTYIPPISGQSIYTISMSGMSPWGWNVVKKNVYVPFTGMTINNPNGEAFFYPSGGNWSATPISYDYIFSGDAVCDATNQSITNFTTIPFLVTGYTKSSLNDLQVYGNKNNPTLFAGKFIPNLSITGSSGSVGVFLGTGTSVNVIYTAYTIDDITYYDYPDGTTLFVVQSSGLTANDLVCSAITKDEVLLNVIDLPEVQSNVYIERGKNSGLESLQRLGEVNSVGDINNYGYKFFTIIKT